MKRILAPMVRIGTLPMRVLALQYGADLVYSPELVDLSLVRARRVVKQLPRLEHPVVDFVDDASGRVLFRTCPAVEKARLIIQLGSSDPRTATRVATLVAADCLGIDLNCGCPKRFSTQAGMGSALLETPDLLLDIVASLLAIIGRVSVKLRLLADQGAMEDLVRRLALSGIWAVAIHGRTRHQTYDVSADWERVHCLARLAKSLNPRLQVFLSGDVALSPRHCSPQPHHHHHQHHYCDPSLIDGLLYARSAQWNVSLLSPSVSDVSSVSSSNGLSSLERVICEYLDVAWRFGAHEANVKYALVEMLTQPADFCPAPDYAQHVGQLRRRTLSPVYKAKTLAELMAIFGVEHDQAESAAGVATDSELVEWGYSADKQHARLHAKMQTQ